MKPKDDGISNLGREVKALLTDPELVEMAKPGEFQNLGPRPFRRDRRGRPI